MSKRFKSQDYFRYKKLGKRWRRPVGWQSKMRLGKGGSGLMPGVGYGTAGKEVAILVRGAKDLEQDCKNGIIFAKALGAKKVAVLTQIAKEKGITILNMKKVKRSAKIVKTLASKKTKKEHKKEEPKVHKEEKKEEAVKEHKHEEKKEGDHAQHVHHENKHSKIE